MLQVTSCSSLIMSVMLYAIQRGQEKWDSNGTLAAEMADQSCQVERIPQMCFYFLQKPPKMSKTFVKFSKLLGILKIF